MSNKRFYFLDLLRILAASSVILYHYLYRGWKGQSELSVLNFDFYDGIFKYGYLGVQIFFIISGFVIYISSAGKTPKQFLISRMIRLYPMYWICLLTTLIFIYAFNQPAFYIDPLDAALNFLMFSKLFGVPFVDGAYWTLIYDLVFYFWFYIIIYFKLEKNDDEMYILLIAAALIVSITDCHAYVKIIFGGSFIGYFYLGIFFYKMFSKKLSYLSFVALFMALLLSIFQLINQVQVKNSLVGSDLNIIICVSVIGFVSFLFYGMIKGCLDFLNKNYFSILGIITYPCYLLHQNIGYVLFNEFGNEENQYVVLVLVLLFIYSLSYLYAYKIESKVSHYFRSFMEKLC